MELFIDTLDLAEIRKYADLGILAGVTTNPTFMKQYGYTDNVKMINDIHDALGDGEIHVEALGTTTGGIVSKAIEIRNLVNHRKLIFKIPFDFNGIKAAYILQKRNIACNLHLIFSPNQAIVADQTHAAYICPLIGRIDDIGYDGISVLRDIREVTHNAKIMASSIRNPKHVYMIAKEKIDAVTVPPKVIELMIAHPLTEKGIELFK